MGWRGYADHNRKIVFFWSQKAACTTLFNVLRDNIPERPDVKKYFHKNSQGTAACMKLVRRRNYASVILVRQPVMRIISAYFNKFCIYEGNALRMRDDLEVFAQELHDFYCRRRGTPMRENLMSFEDFLNTVEAMHAKRAKPNQPINGHWDTQIPAYLAQDGFQYDHVLHVETFDQEMAVLANKIGLDFTPRQLNRTPVVDTQDTPPYLGHLPGRKVADMTFGYRNFITPETLEQIAHIYAVDFKAFGYQLDPYAPEPPRLIA